MPLRLAVIGDPVAHSASPALHRAFLAEAGMHGTYEAVRVAAGDAARAIEELRAAGFRGINVTTPLKEEAFAHCTRQDALAAAARSVNTIVFARDGIAGYNTDGIGAIAALCEASARASVTDLAVLVLGAGPTARAAARALADAGATTGVWSRSQQSVDAALRASGASPWTALTRIDAVFAALPPEAELADGALRAAVLAAPVFVDANYGPRARLASALGRDGADGTAMLRASARASFQLFVPR
jgi:shikimate dehydrogenase